MSPSVRQIARLACNEDSLTYEGEEERRTGPYFKDITSCGPLSALSLLGSCAVCFVTLINKKNSIGTLLERPWHIRAPTVQLHILLTHCTGRPQAPERC